MADEVVHPSSVEECFGDLPHGGNTLGQRRSASDPAIYVPTHAGGGDAQRTSMLLARTVRAAAVRVSPGAPARQAAARGRRFRFWIDYQVRTSVRLYLGPPLGCRAPLGLQQGLCGPRGAIGGCR